MYAVIEGRWCHINGEPLQEFDKHVLSKQIQNIKSIARITTSDNLTAIFNILTHKSDTIDLVKKIFNQSDSTNAIINKKL